MSSSGELTTERIGRPRSPMSATDLAHDDDDDDDDDDVDDDDDDFLMTYAVQLMCSLEPTLSLTIK